MGHLHHHAEIDLIVHGLGYAVQDCLLDAGQHGEGLPCPAGFMRGLRALSMRA